MTSQELDQIKQIVARYEAIQPVVINELFGRLNWIRDQLRHITHRHIDPWYMFIPHYSLATVDNELVVVIKDPQTDYVHNLPAHHLISDEAANNYVKWYRRKWKEAINAEYSYIASQYKKQLSELINQQTVINQKLAELSQYACTNKQEIINVLANHAFSFAGIVRFVSANSNTVYNSTWGKHITLDQVTISGWKPTIVENLIEYIETEIIPQIPVSHTICLIYISQFNVDGDFERVVMGWSSD